MATLKEKFGIDRFLLGERTISGQPLTLNQQRIFILPTQRGLGFALLILILTLIAFVYNNNLTYLLAFLLGSIFFITILHTYQCLAGLVLQENQPLAVFAGETASFSLTIDNPTPVTRQHLQLKIKDSEQHFTLEAQSKTQLSLHDATQKRGWHSAGTVTIYSTYPLGLFRAWSPLQLSGKVLVYPKPARVSLPFPEAHAISHQQGNFNKGGDEFYGLQTYQTGDSIRHVHWKAYAKGLGLFSKHYRGESAAELWLDYEQTPGSSIEERLSCLCRWVIDAEQSGLRYGFILPGLRLEPNQGSSHYCQCLEALALF